MHVDIYSDGSRLDAQIVLDLVAGRSSHLLTDPALATCIGQLQQWQATHPLRLHKVKAHTPYVLD